MAGKVAARRRWVGPGRCAHPGAGGIPMHGRRLHSHRARCTFVRVVTVRLAAGVALQQAKIWASVDGPLAEEAVPLEAVPAEQLPDHVKLRHSAVVLSTVCNRLEKNLVFY